MVAWCFVGVACFSGAELPKYIRVSVLNNASSLVLRISGNFEIKDGLHHQVLYQGKGLATTVTVYKGGISIGPVNCLTQRIFVKTWGPDEIILNGRVFKGDMLLIRDSNRLSAVNYVELEDYIKGVLYHEVSHYWPEEALRAQAVVSRTFVLYQAQANTKNDFDVTNDTYSQLYGGLTSERFRTNRAVDETRRQVLTYKKKLFPTYFSATCGGHTEDSSVLWNISLPPLKGVVCEFCKESPHYNWHVVLSQDEVRDKLKAAGYKVKKVKSIEIQSRDSSGRITGLKLIDDDRETKIKAKDFRSIIGSTVIRSTNFTVSPAGDDLVFEGFGWGHGVGMCQWGSYFFAKAGRTHQEILKYYYPGSALISLDTLR